MSRSWRQNKEKNQRVRKAREQLMIVQAAIVAVRGVLEAAANDPASLLTATARLDALLRRQDRLQRVIERARDTQHVEQQTSAKPSTTADAELAEELARRGLLT